MKLRRSLPVLAVLMLPLAACGLIIGIDEHDFTTPGGTEGGAFEAGPDVPAIPARCTFGAVPPDPAPSDDNTKRPVLVFAVRHATLRGRNAEHALVGFDFDGVCSCDSRDHSEHEGGVSCLPPEGALQAGGCDEDGGVDNAIAYTFDLVEKFGNFASAGDSINAQISCGSQTMIYSVYDYNGQANDPEVILTGVQSNGIHEPQDGGIVDEAGLAACGVTADGFDAGLPYPAKFDGTDVWSRPTLANTATVNGYVRDFKLVLDGRPRAGLTNPTLPLLFGSRVLNIGTPIVVAQLVPLDENGNKLEVDSAGKILSPSGKASSFRLENGLVGGRASAADVLVAAATIRISGAQPGKSQLCDNIGQYCFLKSYICSSADSMQSPSRDFKDQACDALTVVLQFDAVVAQLALLERPAETSTASGCADNFTDGCGDAAVVDCGAFGLP